MRGEKSTQRNNGWLGTGSPPHARGKDIPAHGVGDCRRITPACAGKSKGENKKNWRATGSPPHARGKEAILNDGGLETGITPACAGKSALHHSALILSEDHPRMRGEKRAVHPGRCGRRGSPPHARGKDLRLDALFALLGITPACAGKSQPGQQSRCHAQDHPRMRGEKKLQIADGPEDGGSPPHARGKEIGRHPGRDKPGITPACAGKRALRSESTGKQKDHPRMRGEKSSSEMVLFRTSGSPPHARGKVAGGKRGTVHRGITPACAGKSLSPCTGLHGA